MTWCKSSPVPSLNLSLYKKFCFCTTDVVFQAWLTMNHTALGRSSSCFISAWWQLVFLHSSAEPSHSLQPGWWAVGLPLQLWMCLINLCVCHMYSRPFYPPKVSPPCSCSVPNTKDSKLHQNKSRVLLFKVGWLITHLCQNRTGRKPTNKTHAETTAITQLFCKRQLNDALRKWHTGTHDRSNRVPLTL